MYRILLFVHVLAVIGWVGAGYLFQFMTERILKVNDSEKLKSFIRGSSVVPAAYFAGLSVVVLISGTWLVLETGYGFEEPFVVGGIVAIIASGAIGGAVISKTVERLGVLAESPTSTPAELRDAAVRLRSAGRLDVAIVTVAVFLMTVKPGS